MIKVFFIVCSVLIPFNQALRSGTGTNGTVQPGMEAKTAWPGKEDKTAQSRKETKKEIIICEQAENRIAIVDVQAARIIWSWSASAANIQAQDIKWFNAPSDAKPVYDNNYILLNASGGGVALVRVADKKTVFYAYAGGNTHSAELLPDGNIVAASSDGNCLTVFHTDTLNFPGNLYQKKIHLPFAHNVVWDRRRKLLWSAGRNKLYALKYNFDCERPDLTVMDSVDLPGKDAHDLFPDYGKDRLTLTTIDGFFQVLPSTKAVSAVEGSLTKNIKSVSSGPDGFPTIIIQPKEQWWTDEVLDTKGNRIFEQKGLRIYKARWLLPNAFSYPAHHSFKLCQ